MDNIKTEKTKPIIDNFKYIGDDGKLYPTPEALEEANKTYWENWKKSNNNGNALDISHLRALDGSYHSNPEIIKEINRRFRETHSKQINNMNSKRNELLGQLLADPKYVLNCAGINFVKQIYQIDPQIIQGLLELMLDSTKTGDFENLESKFIDMLSIQAGLKQNDGKVR